MLLATFAIFIYELAHLADEVKDEEEEVRQVEVKAIKVEVEEIAVRHLLGYNPPFSLSFSLGGFSACPRPLGGVLCLPYFQPTVNCKESHCSTYIGLWVWAYGV